MMQWIRRRLASIFVVMKRRSMKKIIVCILTIGLCVQSGSPLILHTKAISNTLEEVELVQETNTQQIKKNFLQYVAGDEIQNANAALATKISATQKAAEAAIKIYKGMDTLLFEGLDLSDGETVNKQNSDNLYKTTQNIYKIALAYGTSGTKYYKDVKTKDLLCEALDLFYNKTFVKYLDYFQGEDKLVFGNWFNWEIGMPTQLTNSFVILEKELQETHPKVVENYISAFDNYLRWGKFGDVDLSARQHTGANLVDITTNRILQGALTKNTPRIEKAVKDMMTVFKTIDPYQLVNGNTDGVYEDGSFIQHHRVAYTGSYGKVLLQRAMQSLVMLNGTPWQPTNQLETLQNWIYNSFLPLMYEGYTMEIVKGRAISRTATGYADTTGVIESMVLLSSFLSMDEKAKMESQIKYMVSNMPSGFSIGGLGFAAIVPYLTIANNSDILPISQLAQGAYAFNAMDKNVQIGNDYAFALSRSSNRVSKYEYMSGENLKPWFQGDGAFYLYLSKRNQTSSFGVNYMAAIDPYRLPGTTVANQNRLTIPELYGGSLFYPGYEAGSEKQNDYVYFPIGTNHFSGSVVFGKNSVAGMQLGDDNAYMAKTQGLLGDDFIAYKNANANKSWFMLGDTIVAVGSNIQDEHGRNVTTTIDNRMSKISETTSIKAMNNNKEIVELTNGTYDHLTWVTYRSNEEHTSVGYYFPQPKAIQIAKETRTGNLKDIRSINANKVITENFLTMTYEHGKNPQEDNYSYVMLPNADETKTAAFAENPNIEIIENSKNIHVVKDRTQNLTGYNFFDAGTSNGMTSMSAVSILQQQETNGMTIAVSDPLFEQDEITIYLDGLYQLSQKSAIRIEIEEGKTKITVPTKQLYGKSVVIHLVATQANTDVKPIPEPEAVIETNSVEKESTNIQPLTVEKTGDTTKMNLFVGLFLLSLGGGTVFYYRWKKNSKAK